MTTKNAQLDSFSRMSEYSHYSSGDMGEWSLLDEAWGDFDQGETLCNNDGGVSLILIESRPGGEQAE